MLNKLLAIKSIRLKQWQIIAFALTVCFTQIFDSRPCQSQYFGLGSGIGYNGIGSSLLFPLSYLFYGSGNSYASPFYGMAALGSGFANNALYNSYRNIPLNYAGNYAYSNSAPYYSNNNYPLSTTNNTNSPFNYNYMYNQNQTSGWNYSPNQTPVSTQKLSDPNDIFNSSYTSSGLTSNRQNQTTAPAKAGERYSSNQANLETNPSALIANTAAVSGFFQTVNTRYKGNLIHALNQNDMRCWAQSLGLFDANSQNLNGLNQYRKNQISLVVKDPSLNPTKKLEILHLLLSSQ